MIGTRIRNLSTARKTFQCCVSEGAYGHIIELPAREEEPACGEHEHRKDLRKERDLRLCHRQHRPHVAPSAARRAVVRLLRRSHAENWAKSAISYLPCIVNYKSWRSQKPPCALVRRPVYPSAAMCWIGVLAVGVVRILIARKRPETPP